MVFLLVLALLSVPSAHAQNLPALDTPQGESTPVEVPLTEAMHKKLVGLTTEGLDRGELNQLRAQAEQFIRYRSKRMSAKDRLLWVARCLSPATANPFCRFVGDDDAMVPEAASTISSATRALASVAADPEDVADALTHADFSRLKNVSETTFQHALSRFDDWSPLKKLAEKALTRSSCPSSALLVALGQKAEQFFPDQKFRDLALKLFERSGQCGNGDSADKARFRASLLHIWNGDCAGAIPLLTHLADQPDGDWETRSLYWRGYCAKKSGNKMLTKLMRTRILKENPLSYHGLLLSHGHPSVFRQLLDDSEPLVQFRSRLKPELNLAIRGVELLQTLHANGYAREMLAAISDHLDGTEPAFRLYVALLTNRSGDAIGQLKILSSVFRDDPSTISRSTLELFYPLKQFAILKRHHLRLDPFLIAALIRQESGFNSHARSPAGAIGLMQLMPQTARRYRRHVSRRALYNPTTNVRIGVRYFQQLINRYHGDVELALAAYNAGPEKVDEWVKRYPTPERMLMFDLIPYPETRDYVALIARNYYWYLSLYDVHDLVLKNEGRMPASSGRKKALVFTLFSSL